MHALRPPMRERVVPSAMTRLEQLLEAARRVIMPYQAVYTALQAERSVALHLS